MRLALLMSSFQKCEWKHRELGDPLTDHTAFWNRITLESNPKIISFLNIFGDKGYCSNHPFTSSVIYLEEKNRQFMFIRIKNSLFRV